jgi:phosphomevalonate kinase
MTRARAPGKVVLSGAYAVLSGAPAIVTAVSRYVTADTDVPASLLTEEVRAALSAEEVAPGFDAGALRQGSRKLGLGSSAAILVASLFALEMRVRPDVDVPALRERVLRRALVAHRVAQGGGSGVDVAASTMGGTLVYRLGAGEPELASVELPRSVCFEVWTCPTSASTRELLAAVARLALTSPDEHAHWLGAQAHAARAAALSVTDGDARGLLVALAGQYRALQGLGKAAGVPIVTPELEELGPLATAEGGVLLPAGAGGGDIALFAGASASSLALREALAQRGHEKLDTELSAPGVQPA